MKREPKRLQQFYDSFTEEEIIRQEPVTKNTEARPVKTSRKKKRSVVNNRLSLRMSLIFFSFMLILAILLTVLPRPVTSSIERRTLATVPELTAQSYFSGDYTSGITLAYDDTVPARDSLKNISNNIKSAFGISTANTVEVIGAVSRVADNTDSSDTSEPETENTAAKADQEAAAQPETTTAAEQKSVKNYHEEVVETVNENGIIVAFQDGHWRAMSLIQYSYDSLYNDVVNYIRQVVDSDVNIYFMPIPVAAEYYCPPDYVDYTTELKDAYKEVSSQMISGIKCLDLIPVLESHIEEAIYLRTDHHWTPLGAYYAAKFFAENANVPFADLDKYTTYVNEGYVGTMYAFTESANILNDPEEFIYYVPTNGYTVDYYDEAFDYVWTAGLFADTDVDNSYLTFMGGDTHIVKVTTDVGNGRRLLVVKDSFGNAMIPCLSSSFEEIYVVDERYCDVNLINFIAYNNITDVLFCNNYFNLIGAFAELLEFITYSNYDVEIFDDAPEAVIPDRSGNKPAEEDSPEAPDDEDAANDTDEVDEAADDAPAEDVYDTDTGGDYDDEYYDDEYYEDEYSDDGYYDDGYYDDEYNNNEYYDDDYYEGEL